MNPRQAAVKRATDFVLSLLGLLTLGWLILLGWLAVRLTSRGPGFFRQERVGRGRSRFRILKLRTMRHDAGPGSVCTTEYDPRITPVGRWLRLSKVDELPQLWNVLVGDMSLVGPRPDVPGFADLLTGEAEEILALRPGITGPASLAFADEERLLATVDDPERYNLEVLWPRKVAINLDYLRRLSLVRDLGYMLATVLPPLRRRVLPQRPPYVEGD
jgi:lipopolysaccharide/colanic/teichoic acid biosynthesis glycosyltransferase